MLRVCLLNDSFPPMIDGVSNAVLNYAQTIHDKGGHSVVVTPEYPDVTDVYPFPVFRYPSLNTTRLVGYRTGLPLDPRLMPQLQKEDCNIIHSHCPVISTLLARGLREASHAPVIFTYHTKFDIEIANALRGELLQEAAVKLLVRNVEACDEVWVVSRGAGENLRSLGFEGSYRVMENGVDLPRGALSTAEQRQLLAQWPLPEAVPIYLFVGRLMWYKGIRLILDALAGRKTEQKPFHMVFVGAGGDEDEIREQAEALGLSGHCLFTGAVQDRQTLRAWYSRADLLLFPSTFDTNGLVVREAAACGLPSLLIEGSCAAEGVRQGETGILIPERAEALQSALAAFDGKEDALRRIGESAMAQLYLSWEDSVLRACARYEELLDEWPNEWPSRTKRERHMDELMEKYGELRDSLEQTRQRIWGKLQAEARKYEEKHESEKK